MAPRRTNAASRIKPQYAQGEPEDYIVPLTYPWPRDEGTEISITDENIPKTSETRWDKEASRRYNTLLNTNIFPTHFVDAGALSDLGLHEDLHAVLQVLGIADRCTLIWKTVLEQAFWKFIASGDFKSRSASQSHICNPVLRITAKVQSNLLFTKDQTSKVTRGELQMLCAGVEDELKSSDIGIPTALMTTSPGCVLAQMFVDKKARVVKGSLKKDHSGSLLTPLFRHLEIDLSVYQCNETATFIDILYLINCQILRDENTYNFLSQDGRNLYCKLPQPNITSLSDVTNICFVPDAQYLCADPK
ncbi:hypothetical protein DY000_02052396 [Brassica cretica]|uniref:Arabidopsis retrotransposon Orf1 C-terminal domain-containing protein n=1 Tax=Brassica cretica TaxID=69181 RepID=A0ABQ7A5W6_BRACR|nr:hypothetical protein DY000_02052396 [Brassica cretica]